MPFSEPIRTDEPMEIVRRIARLANLLLELRTEYERRPRPQVLQQIKERAVELHDLANQLPQPNEPLPPPGQSQSHS